MMERYLVRYFLAVIDQGNFSKAASICNVSQPTLSVGIANLEKILGKALFLRTNRRVELTEAGGQLAIHARQIESVFAAAEREVGGTPAAPLIRLGILATIPTTWIEAFLDRRAGMGVDERVELIEGRERELLERLTRGRIDIALTIKRDTHERLHFEALFSEGYSLAVSASHPTALFDLVSPEQLINETMIVRRQCELLAETSRYFIARGIRPFFPGRTTNDDRALAYVRSGLGVTIMPDGFSHEGVARPRLSDFTFTRTVGLMFAPHGDAARLRSSPTIRALTATIERLRTGGSDLLCAT